MFQLNIFTITWNMHKLHVSLQKHATALPHQWGLKWCRPRPSTMLTWFITHALDRFSKSGLNFPLLRGKMERTMIHWQVSTWSKHQGRLETLYLLCYNRASIASASLKAHQSSIKVGWRPQMSLVIKRLSQIDGLSDTEGPLLHSLPSRAMIAMANREVEKTQEESRQEA